jgi:hypothetical protein
LYERELFGRHIFLRRRPDRLAGLGELRTPSGRPVRGDHERRCSVKRLLALVHREYENKGVPYHPLVIGSLCIMFLLMSIFTTAPDNELYTFREAGACWPSNRWNSAPPTATR